MSSDDFGNLMDMARNTSAAKQEALPVREPGVVVTDAETLAAAFHLAYLAGRADSTRENETYVFLRRTIRNMQRALRRAKPTPREGIEAGLDLMLAAVDNAST